MSASNDPLSQGPASGVVGCSSARAWLTGVRLILGNAPGLAAILLLAAPAMACASARAPTIFPNFAEVHPFLYRGGRPTPGHLAELKARGIKTILSLRHDRHVEAERKEAAAVGLTFINLPQRPLGRPNLERLNQALDLLDDPARWPILVTCKRGSDRTGVVIACYRIRREGWTAEQALQEAEAFGMGWWEWGMKRFLRAGCESGKAGGDTGR